VGTANIDLVYAVWGHLPHRQFRMLVMMARLALDTESDDRDPRVYWGGHDRLALAIGQNPPDQPEPDDDSIEADDARRQRHSALEQVRRDVRSLERAGALSLQSAGSRVHQRNAVYRLNLDTHTEGQRTKKVRSERTERVSPTHRNGEPSAPPSGGLLQVPQSLPSNTSNGHQLGGESHQRAGEEGDAEYDKARKALDVAGPEIAQQALEAARAYHRNASTREAIILAARHLPPRKGAAA
jgi:hypothetical protein